MTAYTFDQLARRGAIATIHTYQQYLSPHKGFACPHRVLHQDESCSEYIKRLLGEQSLLTTLKMAPARFQACHLAAKTLQTTVARQQGGCIIIPCCIPI